MCKFSSTIVLTRAKIEQISLSSIPSIIISIIKLTAFLSTDAKWKIHYLKKSIKSCSKPVLFKK